ncbi:hypothetical protein HPP92_011148 [Vanilla planifolia]|uniref:Amino acid transporter transmembrane domain-containing protein n=1 Tax=Vanilla planifolia TaxID=51239 RepID=A0A835R298_VANPL|nr:hypothetical protein HPP92_011148 [Vanilla planifolia]
MHGIRRLRRRRTRKPPHRLRLLQSFLASRHCQRRHSNPPCRRLPGVLPTPLCLHREMGQPDMAGLKFFSKEIRIRLCSNKSYNLNLFRLVWRSAFVVLTTVISMLLPFFNDVVGLPRRARVLASHGLFSGGDVHSSEEGAQVEYEVGLPSDAELCLPRDLRRRGRRVHRRSGQRSQSVPAVQIGIMRILCLHLFSVTVTVLHYSFAS